MKTIEDNTRVILVMRFYSVSMFGLKSVKIYEKHEKRTPGKKVPTFPAKSYCFNTSKENTGSSLPFEGFKLSGWKFQ